jgi:predicted enzyme related to lactoylglutathione lyase
MLAIGDIHIHARDFAVALRFWGDGLGLVTAEQETTPEGTYARLDFPDGGPSLVLISESDVPGAAPPEPDAEAVPAVSFEVTTDEFDDTLVRLLECGGQQFGEVEEYSGLRLATIADPEGNAFDLIELPAELE